MTVLRAEQPSSKDERYREIVSVFARNGIGIPEERFSKHDVMLVVGLEECLRFPS
jgi:hypothetical protein